LSPIKWTLPKYSTLGKHNSTAQRNTGTEIMEEIKLVHQRRKGSRVSRLRPCAFAS